MRFLTVPCEGKLRELLDKAARRMHTQIPTFMTDGRHMKTVFLIHLCEISNKKNVCTGNTAVIIFIYYVVVHSCSSLPIN